MLNRLVDVQCLTVSDDMNIPKVCEVKMLSGKIMSKFRLEHLHTLNDVGNIVL